ncbi:PadR family transcriptional regulator [Jeotgalibacillus marinus]|uniref:PadR family transcriptional regulator n=1 Tax=Jeotgalibacillus marinus TaxID=86667 RepID=A0ABV3Q6K8_9BACL
MDKEQWKGSVEFIVLSLIRKKDMYGFMMINTVNKIREAYQLSEGTLYSILKRLERKGYIESYWGDETQGGRRKYYRITEEGKDLHHNKMQSWIDINNIISTLNEE